ncbi:MAG: metallophosphoesterase [Oligoflexia bacterium]|nr:metallophosphoesterase [Oligoflexia bacterium]MBF0366533.1 metallophosphoesterase [Oligoflexia bacterium]
MEKKAMMSPQKNKIVLVVSDLHLGAGHLVNSRKNLLEDFDFDQEFSEFIDYHSSESYYDTEVELIINGDFLDFLAIPFVPYFDDEYWKESASIEKLKLIISAHQLVFNKLKNFLLCPNKKIVYLFGNHDAEMLFPRVREYFIKTIMPEQFSLENRPHLLIFPLEHNRYSPLSSILIKHGHDYESAHSFKIGKSIIKGSSGELYFRPPWGVYYVTRVLNRFKDERRFINAIRPIRTFVIYGIIFDTLFTLRFIFANIYYFIMVIFLSMFRQKKKLKLNYLQLLKKSFNETKLFQDYESLTKEEFIKDPQLKILIVGHTHIPVFRTFADGTSFINTGSWVRMFHLDFSRRQDGHRLTYAQITIEPDENDFGKILDHNLFVWEGNRNLPYAKFNL